MKSAPSHLRTQEENSSFSVEKMASETRDGIEILSDTKDYLGYFQLEADPFSATESFYFESRSQSKTLDRLSHLCRFGDMIMLIVGKPGMGKTTLKRAICARLDAGVSISQVDATLMMSEENLLREVASGFDLAISDAMGSSDLRDVLVRHGDEMLHDGRVNLVIVDDAEQLEEDALCCLLNLAAAGQLHLMLLADPGLNQRGAMRALGDQLYQFDLAKFEKADVSNYLQARFSHAGGRSAPPFSRAHVNTIFNKSKGIPALINRQAEGLLVAMMGEGSSRKLGLPMGHMAAVVAVGGALVLAFLFRADLAGVDLSQALQGEPESMQVEPAQASTTTTTAGSPTEDPTDRSPTERSPTDRSPTDRSPTDRSPTPLAAAPADAHAEATGAISYATDSVSRATVSGNDPSDPARHAGSLTTDPSGSAAKPTDTVANPTDTVANPTDTVANATDTVAYATGTATEPSSPSLLPGTRLVTAGHASLPEPARKSPYKTESWLMSIESERYTLQLVGARSEDRIIEFIQQQRNPTEFAYFETRYQSESWFVVVLGDYRDRQAALRAIDRLPPEIRRENPWARSIQSVQESIAQQRDGR
jgi:septal ring-binding cell division protein DamX/type II secretory pathway predicted ATPase ExeA